MAGRRGYRPHRLARSLATGRTGRIGFAERFELDTVVHTSGRDQARVRELVRSNAFDGLLIHANPGDPIFHLVGDLRIPAVALADPVEGLPSVVVNDAEDGALLAQHLALVKQSLLPPASATIRVRAFCERSAGLGLETVMGDNAEGGDVLTAPDLRLLTEGAVRATAIIGWSDATSESLCHRLEAQGLAIPKGVAMVGFDGLRPGFAPKYELTTIRAPWAGVGREAVRLLATLLAGDAVPLTTMLPVSFHHGATS